VATVLQKISTSKHLSPQAVNDVVQSNILPYVDFRAMARSSVGFYWRRASAQQKEQLTQQFEKLLVRTYSGALSQVGSSKVLVEPLRAAPGASSVVVRTRVLHEGQLINIAYRMRKEASGWKVVDMNILGVWLVDNYRGVFAEQIQNSGIDGLIHTLTLQNQANSKS
jgi:phospholipid transport system substrate-binding protein